MVCLCTMVFALLMLVMLFLTVVFLQSLYFLFTNVADSISGNSSCCSQFYMLFALKLFRLASLQKKIAHVQTLIQRISRYSKCEGSLSKNKGRYYILCELHVGNIRPRMPMAIAKTGFLEIPAAGFSARICRKKSNLSRLSQHCVSQGSSRIRVVPTLHFSGFEDRAFGSPLSVLPCAFRLPVTRRRIELQLSFAFNVCMKRFQCCSSHPSPFACFLFVVTD